MEAQGGRIRAESDGPAWEPPTTWSSPSPIRSWQPGSGRRCTSGWSLPGRGLGVSYIVGGLSIDYAPRRVAVTWEPVELTATEDSLLDKLAVHAPGVLNESLLLRRVWGPKRVGEGGLLRDVAERLHLKLGTMPPAPGTSSPGHGWGIGWRRGKRLNELPQERADLPHRRPSVSLMKICA